VAQRSFRRTRRTTAIRAINPPEISKEVVEASETAEEPKEGVVARIRRQCMGEAEFKRG
jgi:hypothetical protein